MRLFNFTKPSSATGGLPTNLQNDGDRFRIILENIEDGVILLDGQKTVQLLNPGAAKLCGWNPDEATGLNVDNILQLVDEKGQAIDASKNPIAQTYQTGQSTHANDAFLVNQSKQQISISLKVTPILDNNKRIVAAIAIFGDVGEQRAQEKQRADFISTASHEMRTPVAAIEGYLALALNDKVATIDTRARNYLEKAHASTQNLGKLFQDLLTSAKAEDGRLTSHPGVVEIGEFLEQFSSDVRLIAEKHDLFLDFVVGSSSATVDATTNQGGVKVIKPLYYVYVDPDRLREVLTNLFDNAVKYCPEGKITIGLTGNDKVIQCYVKDTGNGIPPDDLPHLFQKFYRVDSSFTRTIGGTGLGLFISRKIIELYNGRIWVESKQGEGSIFYINLPRLTNERAKELQAAESTNV
jgi:two-component system, OmpR family, sensor histidine kinase VicK